MNPSSDFTENSPLSARPGKSAVKTTLGKRLRLLWLAIILGAASPMVQALSSDRSQAVTIHADAAERDELKGTITYSGNVVMRQGTMQIRAEEVIIYNDKNKVTKIVARGTPARYQQKPSEDQELVVAEANTLEYDLSADALHLIENASLKQEGTSLTGNFINYDVKKSVVRAGGNAAENERVRMVIPARSLQNNDE